MHVLCIMLSLCNLDLLSSRLVVTQCGLHNESDINLVFVKDNFLTIDSVQPAERSPTLVSAERYSRLKVQRVQAANNKTYTVLFLLTGETD